VRRRSATRVGEARRPASPAPSCQKDHQLRASFARRSWRSAPALAVPRAVSTIHRRQRIAVESRGDPRHHARRRHIRLAGSGTLRHGRHRDDFAAVETRPIEGCERARGLVPSRVGTGIRSREAKGLAVEVSRPCLHDPEEDGDRDECAPGPGDGPPGEHSVVAGEGPHRERYEIGTIGLGVPQMRLIATRRCRSGATRRTCRPPRWSPP
jgi:hypothetical protein